jgi:hypothetical protein
LNGLDLKVKLENLIALTAELKDFKDSKDPLITELDQLARENNDRLDKIEQTEVENKLNDVTLNLVRQAVAEIIYPVQQQQKKDIEYVK